jgi:hypothetical protein
VDCSAQIGLGVGASLYLFCAAAHEHAISGDQTSGEWRRTSGRAQRPAIRRVVYGRRERRQNQFLACCLLKAVVAVADDSGLVEEAAGEMSSRM